jgi:DNA-binding beta-propeller fold protein YncE
VAECCVAAPPVLVFNQAGDVIRSWGGKGEGYDWPSIEHGIAIDAKGNVWIGGSATRAGRDGSPADGQILKFTPEGKFLMQIGHAGPAKGSLDTGQLSGPSDMAFDEKANEVYVSDGYGNHRIIVFDMDTGKFKRMWGAYGKPPTDLATAPPRVGDAPPQQFRLVHCIELSNDGLVYVCDRDNNRMQVFRKDGTFVAEYSYAPGTAAPGTVGDISMWPSKGQGLIAIADIGNFTVRIVRRADGRQIATVGRAGPYAGELHRLHRATFDNHGDLYTGEVERVQKFELVGSVEP